MNKSDKWVSSDIESRLENLFEGLDKSESASEAKRPYQDAAAVLASFDPTKLKPITASDANDYSVHEMLGRSELASISTETKWVLAPDLRRQSLKRLIEENRVERALAANPDRPIDLLQRTFEDYLRGIDKPLDRQSIRDLNASLQICDWLYGILPVPSIEDIRSRIEKETSLRTFRDLVGEKFAGREVQIDELSDYVGVFGASSAKERAHRLVEKFLSIRQRPPLMIEAPGGMGKSTLIAQFILINSAAQYVQRFPFAYLDFDRPGLIAEEPITLLMDAIRQFALQFPEAKTRAAQVRQEWQNKAREIGAFDRVSTGSTKFIRFNDPLWFYDKFAEFVLTIRAPGAPVLLVLDTFEEVQYRSKNFVEQVFDFLEAMQSRIPELRTVLAGRATVKLDKYSVRLMKLPPFDREAAQAFLEKQGLTDVGLGFAIADQVGGSPLTLKLAAKLVNIAAEEADSEGIKNLSTGLMARVKKTSIEAQLYHRILDHIHDSDVRKLAHPGLILRKITEELITNVLAEVCGVDVSTPGRAGELFDKLGEEIALVESGDPGVLIHRPDVRSLTLRMLIDDKNARSSAVAINEKAIYYYSGRSGSENRAEEIYHLLLFDLNRARVEPRVVDRDALHLVIRSIEDLPERSRAFLAARVDIDRPELINWNKADLPDWELYAARLARENLVLSKPAAALAVVQQRRERTQNSPLYALEIETLIQMDDIETATNRVESFLSHPRLHSESVRNQILEYQARLRSLQQSRLQTPTRAEQPRQVGSLTENVIVATMNRMIECTPPRFPVDYPDAKERSGDWVESRGSHTLVLPQSFFISPFLVSNELFLEFVRDQGYQTEEFWTVSQWVRNDMKTRDGSSLGPTNWPSENSLPPGKSLHPVTCISYTEARAFVAWFNVLAPLNGWVWTLPPEDCWEFSARGEEGLLYPWGDKFSAERCNSAVSDLGDTTEVDKYQTGQSRVGCYDMAGNVWEFVESSKAGRECVLRGGSFKNNADVVRSHLRLFGVPTLHRPNDFGFRLCRMKKEDPKPEVLV